MSHVIKTDKENGFLFSTIIRPEYTYDISGPKYETMVFCIDGEGKVLPWSEFSCALADTEEEALKNHEILREQYNNKGVTL